MSKKMAAPKMNLGNFNPQELDELDMLQQANGKCCRCPKTNLREYPILEKVLQNDHIFGSALGHARQHHADGGHAIREHLEKYGRPGESEIGMIGPRLQHILHNSGGLPFHNKANGKKEYFLGSLLGGAKKAFGKKYNERDEYEPEEDDYEDNDQDNGHGELPDFSHQGKNVQSHGHPEEGYDEGEID